jgi:hypothetical protein
MPFRDKDYQEGDVIEPDGWRSPEEQAFSHQALVMTSIKRCLELGSKEMREGWWDEKVDRMGNVRRIYNEDTRKAFIESVKSLLMVVECDFDEEAKTKIEEQKRLLKIKKEYWLNQEWIWWCSLNPLQKQQCLKEGKNVSKGFFNKKLDFDNYFFEDELMCYRTICTEVNNLSMRLDFYAGVGGWEG